MKKRRKRGRKGRTREKDERREVGAHTVESGRLGMTQKKRRVDTAIERHTNMRRGKNVSIYPQNYDVQWYPNDININQG